MNTRMLRTARRLWMVEGVAPRRCRANARKWARSLRVLGDRWLFAQPVQRLDRAA